MGQCYSRLDRLELAEAMFREAIQRNEADPLRYVALADVLRRRGQKDKALAAIDEALKRKPDHAEARLLKAQVLADRGDRAPALALVQELLKDPNASGDVKKAARRVLQGLDPVQAGRTPPTIEELLRDLDRNPDPKVRREAIDLLSRVPGVPTAPFVRAVRDQDQNVRVIALRVISARGGQVVLPILKLLVQNDPSKLVRGAACAELGKLTDDGGRPIDAGAPFLLGALQDPEPYVFEQADQALARISGRAPAESVAGGLTPERRAEVSKRWEDWWRSVRDAPAPATGQSQPPPKPK
jgi:tetratricopeptide (TPR) repeat protein